MLLFVMTELIFGVSLTVLFGLWIGATLIYAFPGGDKHLVRLGVFSLFIPKWNFFAPIPGMEDYYLLFRDQWIGGVIGNWKEIPDFNYPRNWASFLWNPKKIEKKILFDLVQEIGRESQSVGNKKDFLQLSIPYLLILNYISCLPRNFSTNTTQFIVLKKSSVNNTIEPYFISAWHKIN